MGETKTAQVFFLISAIVIGLIYTIDLRNDYYYYFTKKEAIARLESIEKEERKSKYFLQISYLNKGSKNRTTCNLAFEGRKGKEIVETIDSSFLIYYTEKSPCDIYFKGYKTPTIGSVLIHVFVLLLSLFGIFIFIKNLKKSFVNQKK